MKVSRDELGSSSKATLDNCSIHNQKPSLYHYSMYMQSRHSTTTKSEIDIVYIYVLLSNNIIWKFQRMNPKLDTLVKQSIVIMRICLQQCTVYFDLSFFQFMLKVLSRINAFLCLVISNQTHYHFTSKLCFKVLYISPTVQKQSFSI